MALIYLPTVRSTSNEFLDLKMSHYTDLHRRRLHSKMLHILTIVIIITNLPTVHSNESIECLDIPCDPENECDLNRNCINTDRSFCKSNLEGNVSLCDGCSMTVTGCKLRNQNVVARPGSNLTLNFSCYGENIMKYEIKINGVVVAKAYVDKLGVTKVPNNYSYVLPMTLKKVGNAYQILVWKILSLDDNGTEFVIDLDLKGIRNKHKFMLIVEDIASDSGKKCNLNPKCINTDGRYSPGCKSKVEGNHCDGKSEVEETTWKWPLAIILLLLVIGIVVWYVYTRRLVTRGAIRVRYRLQHQSQPKSLENPSITQLTRDAEIQPLDEVVLVCIVHSGNNQEVLNQELMDQEQPVEHESTF